MCLSNAVWVCFSFWKFFLGPFLRLAASRLRLRIENPCSRSLSRSASALHIPGMNCFQRGFPGLPQPAASRPYALARSRGGRDRDYQSSLRINRVSARIRGGDAKLRRVAAFQWVIRKIAAWKLDDQEKIKKATKF